jgi:hypothetical protein
MGEFSGLPQHSGIVAKSKPFTVALTGGSSGLEVFKSGYWGRIWE